KPGFLAVNRQFYLNIVISLGLMDFLKDKISDTIHVKWPNDILVHRRKISGILIENQLSGSAITNTVAGIGFNLNQRHFKSPFATSLSLVTGETYDRPREVEEMLVCLERRYLALRRGEYDHLMNDYLGALYGR